MRRPTARLFDWFTRLDGAKFKALMSKPNLNQLSAAPMAFPRRSLHVWQAPFISAGNVVLSPEGQRFLLANYSPVFQDCRSYRLYEVSENLQWTRATRALDPVSGMVKDTTVPLPLGTIWVTFEPMADSDFKGFNIAEARFATGENVFVGDFVGGREVRKVTPALGINFLEVIQ